jgi:hypothetical protein
VDVVSFRPPLDQARFQAAAAAFAAELSATPLPDLYGATDGKAVGTLVEVMFKRYLEDRFDFAAGNAASGLDFPSLNVDLKVTSLSQPQSSCPFKDASQKVYGLGYNLLAIVYVKEDDHAQRVARLDIRHVVYIDKSKTGDHTLTKQILDIIDQSHGSPETAVEEIDALLQDKNMPLDEVSRRRLAERLVEEPPELGVLTISNALQWRLQYTRAISTAVSRTSAPQVVDLRAQ